MRIRNLLIAILTVSSTVAFAQEQRQIKEEGKTVFKPHWFMQVQAGAAHTVGEEIGRASCRERVSIRV